jgi:hypothetical protein
MQPDYDRLITTFLAEYPNAFDGIKYADDASESVLLRSDVYTQFLGWCVLHQRLPAPRCYEH